MHAESITEQQPLIRIRGARTHNLRNVDVDLPAGKLIVMTGISGSGKSSLAFDTLFAEGQRRYLESVSVQTRGLLRQWPRPDVDEITGLAPTISVDQRVTSVPVRSTLATTTEIHDFLRLLYARAGTAHCTNCGAPVQRQSVDSILQQTLQLPERTRLMILSPMVRGRRGAHREVMERIARSGFVRARVDGEVVDISEAKPLDAGKPHTIEAIVDRIVIKEGVAARLRESIDLACRESDGTCSISHETDGKWFEKFFSTKFSCPACDLSFPTPEPRSFSFGSPWGACQACSGLGIEGAADTTGEITVFHQQPCRSCEGTRLQPFPRAVTFFDMTLPQFSAMSVDAALQTINRWMALIQQPSLIQQPITEESTESAVRGAISQEARLVAERTLPDIRSRLKCLSEVGIGYLNLDRPARTLSGGEFQRARLAASLSSQLYGAHFVLDEPTAGLHPRDTQKLLQALFSLRDSGSTVIVVEHDGDIMRAADWLVDLGPGAGADGGRLLFSGTPQEALKQAQSPTGDYLRRLAEQTRGKGGTAARTAVSEFNSRQHLDDQVSGSKEVLRIRNARLHNLKGITVDVPLHRFVCVTGVSGSGKSSLIFGTLLPVLAASVKQTRDVAAAAADVRCDGIEGLEHVRRVLSLDQSPLGRSSRSCIATLCGVWEEVRRLFTRTRDAKAKGFGSQHFSFNSGEGRCSECRGTGVRSVRMNFLPDATVPCPLCHGKRFSKAVSAIRFRGKSVAEVLDMRVDEAVDFFSEFQRLRAVLSVFHSVGLGYLTLGQPATTFSGGEAQRAKLASELAAPSLDHTLFVLDEPTSGLHPADTDRLIGHLRQLVTAGHSVLVIEHQMDVIRASDWILDVGPESGDRGGEILFAGPPHFLADCSRSETGKFLQM